MINCKACTHKILYYVDTVRSMFNADTFSDS